MKDYWLNENTYKESPMFASGILSYDEETPIETWLLNEIETMKGNAIDPPTKKYTFSNKSLEY